MVKEIPQEVAFRHNSRVTILKYAGKRLTNSPERPHYQTLKIKTIEKAIRLARLICPTNRDQKSSHAAFLVRSNVIEKIGFNKPKTHPINKKHPYNVGECGIHAELDACLKIDKEDLRDYSMIVIRVDKNNKLNQSRPCRGCQSVISQFGISEVYYSDKMGDVVKM